MKLIWGYLTTTMIMTTNTNDFVNNSDEIGRSGEKFKFLTDNTMKLIWGYLTTTMIMTTNTNDFVNNSDEIGRSGEKFKFLTDNTMKLMEKRTRSRFVNEIGRSGEIGHFVKITIKPLPLTVVMVVNDINVFVNHFVNTKVNNST